MSTVREPVYELRYSRRLVLRAVRCFAGWRLIDWDRRLVLAQMIVLACAAVLALHGTVGWAALFVVMAAASLLLGLVGWAAHRAYKLRALRAMGAPVAACTIGMDEVRFRSDAGESVLALEAVMAWREWPAFWLLLTAPHRFIILPTEHLPAAVLDTLRGRLEEINRERC